MRNLLLRQRNQLISALRNQLTEFGYTVLQSGRARRQQDQMLMPHGWRRRNGWDSPSCGLVHALTKFLQLLSLAWKTNGILP